VHTVRFVAGTEEARKEESEVEYPPDPPESTEAGGGIQRIGLGHVNRMSLSSKIVAQKLSLNGHAARRRRELRDEADGYRWGWSIWAQEGIPAARRMSVAFRCQVWSVETFR
jgi:hypothetical protein